MVGFVTTRHLFTHSAVIVREFGTVCLLRCLWRTVTADHAVTFLECTVPIHGPLPSLGTHTSLDVATGNESEVLPPRAPTGAARMPPAAGCSVHEPWIARNAASSN
jgi:hypothetical protein